MLHLVRKQTLLCVLIEDRQDETVACSTIRRPDDGLSLREIALHGTPAVSAEW
jgi:hypothetical protein